MAGKPAPVRLPVLVGLMALLCGTMPLPAQEHGPAAATHPPENRVYFEASAESPFLAPLLSQHGCTVPEAGRIRVELPGRVFVPPVDLTAEGDAGRSDPPASMSTRDARFAIVGAAAREGAFGRVGSSDDATADDVVNYAEVCGASG